MMVSENNKLINANYLSSFKNWHILLLVLAGSFLRLWYGFYSNIWFRAHDQLAWELALQELLDNGAISYKQLIHYPHEGGTFFISIFSFCFWPISKLMPVLSFAALVIDSIIRFYQITITKKVIGEKVAIIFGIWTVLGVPALLPWGTAFFGLHSVNSIFPFLFMYCLVGYKGRMSEHQFTGLITGFAIVFSYHNIIFVPAYIFWILFQRKQILRNSAIYVATTFSLLVPHILFRIYVDNGFPFEQNTILSADRGLDSGANILEHLTHLKNVWWDILPSSIFLSAGELVSATTQRNIFLVFICLSFFILVLKKNSIKAYVWFTLITVLLFTMSYAFTSIYSETYHPKQFYDYRHFTYIIPLLCLLLIYSFTLFKIGDWINLLFLSTCIFFSIQYLQETKKTTNPGLKVAGWILSRKYGNDIPKLLQLEKSASISERKNLTFGFGWGLTVHELNGKTAKDSASLSYLIDSYDQFPTSQKESLFKGKDFAFVKGVTPVLDSNFLPLIDARIKSGR